MNRWVLSSCFATSLLTLGGAAPGAAMDETALTQLSVPDPDTYFSVAERLIENERTRVLGSETLALVALLAAESDPSLAASACVALASVTTDAERQSGLWSLAVRLDPDRAGDRRWLVTRMDGVDSTALRSGRVLGLLRNNNPDGVGPIRDEPEIRSRIVSEGVRLGHDATRVSSVLAKWERDTNEDPCRGRMTVRVRDGGVVRVTPCPDPGYHHGTRVDADWSMMLGIEMSLLRATPETWSAQAAVGLDAAVPVWSLDRIARVYGVSQDRPVRRSGGWVAP